MKLFEVYNTPMNQTEFINELRKTIKIKDLDPDVVQKAYELFLKNVAMNPAEAYGMARNTMRNMAFEQEEKPTSGNRNIALNLPRGEMKVLKAEEKDYDRGLLVKLLDNGGYEMAYWYEKHVPFPVEVIVDGKSIKKDAEIVEMKFHPELKPGEEDKVNQFRLYDIEADIDDLRKMLQQAKLKETIEFGQDFRALIKSIEEGLAERQIELENLRDWFGKGKKGGAGGGGWDRYNTKGERIGKCGDSKKGEGKPKCLSKSRAASLRAKGGKKAIGAAVRKKRRNDPNKNRKGKAKNVSNTTKKSK